MERAVLQNAENQQWKPLESKKSGLGKRKRDVFLKTLRGENNARGVFRFGDEKILSDSLCPLKDVRSKVTTIR